MGVRFFEFDGTRYEVMQMQHKQFSVVMHVLINNRMHIISFDSANNKIFVHGKQYNIQDLEHIASTSKYDVSVCKPAVRTQIFDGLIKSPLAGRVVRVLNTAGNLVVKGQPLVVIESMKMENEICANSDGVIKTLFIALGNLVQPNQPLIELEMKGGRDGEPKNADGQATI